MRFPRFIISDDNSITRESHDRLSLSLKEEERHHLLNVLRKSVGDVFVLIADQSRLEFKVKILTINEQNIRVEILEESSLKTTHKIVALVGLCKNKTADFICEKLSEIGVSEIYFYKADRSQYSLTDEEKKKRISRLNKIVEAARKQSGSACSTVVSITDNLPSTLDLISDKANNQEKICLSTGESSKNLKIHNVLAESKNNDIQTTYLLIGCEGGLTSNELSAASNCGFIMTSLGNNILRTETAALVASSLIALYRNK